MNEKKQTFAMTCTRSLAGIIKVLDGALLKNSSPDLCPCKEPSFVKRAIFKMIPKRTEMMMT